MQFVWSNDTSIRNYRIAKHANLLE